MQHFLLQMLARQRSAQMSMVALNGYQRPVPSRKQARILRQRIGWVLENVGLRLVVARGPA
jgi:hypothetical protein